MKLNCWVKFLCETTPKIKIPVLAPPPKYQHLSTSHDWPNKIAIVDFLIRLKKNLKCTSGNLLSL